jgi:hypothetical protein
MADDSWRMFLNDDPDHNEADDSAPLPLGAIVATCVLVDCLPIDSVEHDCQEAREYDRIVDMAPHRHGLAHLWERDGGWHLRTVEDQRPYGDFAVGRWAWLLADIKPVGPPVPAKGKQGLWEWSA